MSTELVPAQHPLVLIEKLLSTNHTPEELKTLFDLHRQWNIDRAREAYNSAMQAVQDEMPAIVCDSHNPQTNSRYPSLASLNRIGHPIWAKHGFHVSFGEAESRLPDHRRWTMQICHRAGHEKEFYLDMPLDGVGIKGNRNMTVIHGTLSSNTYAKSRLLINGFNLTILDDDTDNDGNAATAGLTPDQVGTINDLFAELEDRGAPADKERFYAWLGVDDMHGMTGQMFVKAVDFLTRKLRKTSETKDQK